MLAAMKFMQNREVQDAEIERLFEYAKACGRPVYECDSDQEQDGSFGERSDINVYRVTLPSNHTIIATKEEGSRWSLTMDTNFAKQYVAISDGDNNFVWFAMRVIDQESRRFTHEDERYYTPDEQPSHVSTEWQISDEYTPEIFFTVVDSLEV